MKAMRKTGLVFFPAFDWAISETHPEREERLLYTQDQVFEEGILDIEGLVELNPDLATARDVERVHFCVPGVEAVLTESHYIAAGGCKTVAEAVLMGEVDCGFALVRPPGHHAMRSVHGSRGFCNINSEAVMVELRLSWWSTSATPMGWTGWLLWTLIATTETAPRTFTGMTPTPSLSVSIKMAAPSILVPASLVKWEGQMHWEPR
jgi:hypothetical protein